MKISDSRLREIRSNTGAWATEELLAHIDALQAELSEVRTKSDKMLAAHSKHLESCSKATQGLHDYIERQNEDIYKLKNEILDLLGQEGSKNA